MPPEFMFTSNDDGSLTLWIPILTIKRQNAERFLAVCRDVVRSSLGKVPIVRKEQG